MPHQVLAALVNKHREVAGEIDAMEGRLEQMRADLVHLHAAIRIMDPQADPAAIRPKRPNRQGCDWSGRGELWRLMLEVLRTEREPLTGVELACAVMERRCMDPNDRLALRRIEGMVGPVLRRREGSAVERVADGRRGVRWRLAEALADDAEKA